VSHYNIRIAAIAKHYGVKFKQLIDGGLHVLCLLGQDGIITAAVTTEFLLPSFTRSSPATSLTGYRFKSVCNIPLATTLGG
jgi:hypothetical protein